MGAFADCRDAKAELGGGELKRVGETSAPVGGTGVYRNSRRVSVAFGAAEYSENKITFR